MGPSSSTLLDSSNTTPNRPNSESSHTYPSSNHRGKRP